MRAARWNRPSTIRLLIQLGANIEARDPSGKTALILATGDQHVDAVRTLIECGVDVNARDDLSHTSLHVAARLGNERLVRILLDANAHSSIRDSLGRTPWITAVHFHKDGALKEMLQPDALREEKLRESQREQHPGDIAKNMLMRHP